MFVTQWNSRRQEIGEKNSGKSIVDPSGYMSPKERIESIFRAGERLDEYRREMYQYGDQDDHEDESLDDVTRSPGFDPADASYLRNKAISRIKRSGEYQLSEQSKTNQTNSDVSTAKEPDQSTPSPTGEATKS